MDGAIFQHILNSHLAENGSFDNWFPHTMQIDHLTSLYGRVLCPKLLSAHFPDKMVHQLKSA